MGAEVFHDRAPKTHREVRPSHSRALATVKFIIHVVCNILEVVDSSIVKILTWEQGFVHISRMGIGQWMRICVPSAEAEVKPSHESHLPINET